MQAQTQLIEIDTIPTEMLPRIGEHAAIIGQTGSGKTVLAERILETRRYVVVLDSKGTIKPNKINWIDYKRYDSLNQVVASREDKIIYAPSAKELRDERKIDSFFHWIYERWNTALYVDEATSITSGDELPDLYFDCLARGRERNISVISSTQRPKSIPMVILSESTKFYCFWVNLPQDRKRVAEFSPITEQNILSLDRYEFYFANAHDRAAMGPAKLTGVENGTDQANP